MVDKHERLHSPPLVEAVFELRADTAGSLTVLPGRMATELEGEYPDLKETQIAKFVLMSPPPPEAGFVATHQFRTLDGKGLVQLGPMGFSVNSLAYPGFDAFRSAVTRVLSIYYKQAAVSSVRRLGLRYVNALPPGKPLLSGLTATVNWPEQEGASLASIAARAIFAYTRPQGHLAIAVGAPSDKGTVLDLDFFDEPKTGLAAQEILSWIDDAHQQIYAAFRSMTDPGLFESWKKGE